MAKYTKTKTTNKVPDPASNIIIGKHYSPKQLANLLGVTIPMLTYLRLTGRGPKFIKFGLRNVIYSAVEVDKYLQERERLSTSDDGTKYARLTSYGS
jgi:hypothetical protein